MRKVKCRAVALAIVGLFLCGQRGDAGSVDVTGDGQFSNAQYAYTIRIPTGWHAFRLEAPAPNHGVELRQTGLGSIMWVNGEYDAQMLGDVDAIANDQAQSFCELYSLRITKRANAHLGGLNARELTLEGGGPAIKYLRFILAYRASAQGVGTVLSVGIRQKIRDQTLDQAFEDLASSFRVTADR